MIRLRVVLASALLVGCTKEMEFRGTYVNINGKAKLFPCDQPKEMWRVRDSSLNAAYVRLGGDRMYVRAYGIRLDTGSVYGAFHTFKVRQLVETRAPRPRECPMPDAVLPTQATAQAH